MASAGASCSLSSNLLPSRAAPCRALGSKYSVAGELPPLLRGLSLSEGRTSQRTPTVVCPQAKRICDLTGKKRNNGYSVSFSNHRTKKLQQANLQHKRLWWEAGKRYVNLKLSTKAIKTLEWKGLERMAKEAGIDLKDY